MKYPAKSGGVDFEPVPAGTYTGVCDMVVDLGVQPGSEKYPKPKRQVYIRFELPAERVSFERDGKQQEGPAIVYKIYNASMNEKATLRAHLESWRGKAFTEEEAEDFDTATLLGVSCVIGIVHTVSNGKTYANIASVGKAMKGTEKIRPEITPIYYGPDQPGTYKQLPEWLRKKIDGQILEEKRPDPAPEEDEYPPSSSYVNNPEITDDDIPF